MSPLDRHLTTEQLSALLDHQLSPEDSEESYQAHLQICELCQQELAELRQTVQLLRALPEPPLPRSFTLSLTNALPSSAEDAATLENEDKLTKSTAASPLPIKTRRQTRLTVVPARKQALRTTLRMISGLVAVIGICFVLTGLLGALKTGGASSGSATSGISISNSTSQAKTPSASPNSASPHTSLTPETTQAPIQTPSIQPAKEPSHTVGTTSGPLSTFLFFDIHTIAGQFELGIVLSILGMLGYSLFKPHKPRYMAQAAPLDDD